MRAAGSNAPGAPAPGSILRDPVVRAIVPVLGLLGLPLLVPVLPAGARAAYSESWVSLIQMPLAVVGLGWGLGRVDHPEHRRFARYLMTALSLWWIVLLSYLVFPGAPGADAADVAADLGYLGFYFFVVLAIEARPHRPAGWSAADPARRLRVASAAAFMGAMLAYFVIVPNAANHEAYTSWLPSLCMFVVLDLYVAGRWIHAAATCGSGPWRPAYALLGVAAAGWAVSDLLESLHWAGRIDLSSGGPLDVLWWVPLGLVVVAARIPHARGPAPEAAAQATLLAGRSGTLRAVAPQIVAAFLVPAMHLVGYAAGLLDVETRAARDAVVLVNLVVFAGLVLIQQSVLERRNRSLRDELRRANQRLAQSRRMEAVGRLAGGVAHDFNNQLTAIRGHATLLLERLPPGDPARAEVERIDGAGRRAASLTRQLLAFGRRQVLRPEVLDLNRVVTEMLDRVRTETGAGVEVAARLDPDLGPVHADRGQLEQVLLNLSANARDAMPHGGRLTFETWNEQIPSWDAETDDAPRGDQVVLAVRDTGAGMDARTRERAFEPFFTTKGREATGLGLSTVWGTIRQSGGHILLRSSPGGGTTVQIYLPRRVAAGTPAALARGPKPRRPARPPLGRETVLLVEDDEAIRELACEILEMHGYRVVSAVHGQHALEVFEREAGASGVDLLLTDLAMPVMGGRELASRLVERQPGLRVLYVSGYTDEAALRDGELEPPGAVFLAKPFTPEQLARAVGELLGHRPRSLPASL